MNTLYFASPWFLAGFATLLIPFLLTRAKSFHVTNFSSTLFLRDITQKASNVIQWKKLLLLAVRLTALFLLALAFALPFFNRYHGFLPEGSRTHMVFVLDNSYSMGYRDHGKTLFETAKKKIAAKSKEKGGAVYSLYVFNRKADARIVKSRDERAFFAKLKETKLSNMGTDFPSVFSELKETLSSSAAMKTKVFIVSDFYSGDEKFQAALDAMLADLGKTCEIETVPVQPVKYENLKLGEFLTPARFYLPEEEEEIKIKYESWGMAGREVKVKLEMEGTQLAAEKFKIPETGKGIFSFKHRFPGPGFFPLKVTAQADALSADNDRYLLARVHAPLKILIVEDQEYIYPFDNPNFYLTQVLESVTAQDFEKPWLTLAKSSPESMGSLELGTYDLIVTADLVKFDAKMLTQLKSYVREGGTVLMAPGKNFDLKNYSQPYLAQLTGGSFGAVEKPALSTDFFYPHFVEYAHPLFSVFDFGKKGDLSALRFKAYAPFIPAEKTDYQVLMWFESKAPALVEVFKEKGRIFIWASSLNLEWNDFAKNPLFVPFVFELLRYSSLGQEPGGQNLSAGDTIKFHFSDRGVLRPLTVKTPKGDKTNLFYDAKLKGQSLLADQPGFYDWASEEGGLMVRQWAIVNVDQNETGPNYPRLIANESTKAASSNEAAAGLSKRYFTYLPFIYTVLGLLLVEAWLANRAYKPQWV